MKTIWGTTSDSDKGIICVGFFAFLALVVYLLISLEPEPPKLSPEPRRGAFVQSDTDDMDFIHDMEEIESLGQDGYEPTDRRPLPPILLDVAEPERRSKRYVDQDTVSVTVKEPALVIDGYGPGVHRNRFGAPVTLQPDWGGVPGEQLEINIDAYGMGVHSDQYGRPVREKPWP
jgi:hypothetical protein